MEDYFGRLKSRCRLKHLRFRSAERPQQAVAICSAITWRLMVTTLLGR
ncbi:MAG: hypothetical protein OXH99_02960 [Bryobacterales bacterium]|nr:hypothetical protein [Bryobacterales bacterium]